MKSSRSTARVGIRFLRAHSSSSPSTFIRRGNSQSALSSSLKSQKKSYGNTLSFPTDAKGGPVHTYAIQPLITAAYGLTNHVELGVSTSMISFWTKDTESSNKGRGPWTTDTGMGDTSLIMKYRPIVQDPDSARPSVTLYQQIVLPTSRWVTGTERPPGGFAPLGRLPYQIW